MNNRPDSNLPSTNISRRVKTIAWFNFIFAALHVVFTFGASSRGYYLQGLTFFGSVLGLALGGYYLLKGKSVGKTLTRFSGFLGILLVTYFTCRLTPRFFDPDNLFVDVFESIQYSFILYFSRVFYPIIAGFILLNKPNEELGLS